MAFGTKWTCLIFCLIISLIYNGKQVESELNLRKFGINFGRATGIEEIFDLRLRKFKEKLQLDQKRRHEQEMEKKRNQIFQKYLLSRVTGSVLTDFFGRF